MAQLAIRSGKLALCPACKAVLAKYAGASRPGHDWLELPNWPEPAGGVWQAPPRQRKPGRGRGDVARPKKPTRAVVAPATVKCSTCGQVSDVGREPTMNELIRERAAAALEAPRDLASVYVIPVAVGAAIEDEPSS